MANIPNASNAIPDAYSEDIVESRGVAAGTPQRVAAIIGEGLTSEIVVSSALGNGSDGLDETYTSPVDADGRHFQLSQFPLVSNRTELFINGAKLNVLEGTINGSAFSARYDALLDPTTGQVELQTAYLVDQGGSFWKKSTATVGDGYLGNLSLEDLDAPTETWTIRCVSVQRTVGNVPIGKTAKFVAVGSSSGSPVDSNGNPIVWVANGTVVSNGIIKFGISETQSMGNSLTPFREGDSFVIKVKGGVLPRFASLTANYIPVANLNDAVVYDGLKSLVADRGQPSVTNTLALGAQLAFANGAPVVMALQAAPAMPRRQSFILSDAVDATSTDEEDFIFPLPLGVRPDVDSSIHFFIENPSTSVETQVLPNKHEFYTLDDSSSPTLNQFIFDNTIAPGGSSFTYSVIEQNAVILSSVDGYMTPLSLDSNNAYLTSSSVGFAASNVGDLIKVRHATNKANNGVFEITSVSDNKVYFSNTGVLNDLTDETGINFHLINPVTRATIASGTGTDGAIDGTTGTGVGVLDTSEVNFTTVNGGDVTSLHVILDDGVNTGEYKINSVDTGANTIEIEAVFATEGDIQFELLDPNDTSAYVVINHNIVLNGYGLRVTLVDEKDADFYDAGWINALESLEAYECDIVVPLPRQTISAIFQNTVTHCRVMSQILNKKERVAFVGAIAGLTADNVMGVKPAAVEDIGVLEGIQGDSISEVLAGDTEDLSNYSVKDAFGSTHRCSYFYPDEIIVNTGSNVIVDGFYQAAAAAGYYAGQTTIPMSLTNKVLSGYSIQRSKLLKPRVLSALAQAGVCVTQPVSGGARVIWGLTTSQSGFVEDQEQSIVFIRDQIAKKFRASFTGFIGLPDTPTMSSSISARAVTVLNNFSKDLITGYKNLVVQRDPVLPTQYNISVQVRPIYTVNFIYIRVSIGDI